MLEFYWAYATYQDLMRLTEELIVALAREIAGGTVLQYDGHEIDLKTPWRRLSVKEAVVTVAGKSADVFENPEIAATVATEVGCKPEDIAHVMKTAEPPRIKAGHLGMMIFEHTAEKQLIQPTFLTDFPLAISPLARKKESDPAFTDRFELYIAGREIANGFSELNDPDDQRARFQAQVAAKAAGAEETMDYDEDYCRALETGMPPTAGEGIGIDRLAMLLTGAASIRDVILFPLMRPE
jgi:lysyl-tRNA synthetase class 2